MLIYNILQPIFLLEPSAKSLKMSPGNASKISISEFKSMI
jgi:hypothetical protein